MGLPPLHVLSAGEFARESQERAERLARRQALGHRHGLRR